MSHLHLCVLGDAHVMLLKAGWEKIRSQHPDIRITFFAITPTAMNDLYIDNRRLMHREEQVKRSLRETSGVSELIEVDMFDILVVHGLGLGLDPLLKALHDSGTLTAKESETDATKIHRTLLSLIEATPALALARLIAGMNKPFLLSCQPLPSETAALRATSNRVFWADTLVPGSAAQQRTTTLQATFSQLQSQRGYISQPQDTLAGPYCTLATHAETNSEKMLTLPDQPLPAWEQMNAGFGGLLMANIISHAKMLPVEAGKNRVDPDMTFIEREVIRNRKPVDAPSAKTPYSALPERAFWNQCVRAGDDMRVGNWYRRKFDMSGLRIATAGDFFSQHLGSWLLQQGFDFIDAEPVPDDFSAYSAAAHGYATWSARFGEVNSVRQLVQLFDRAFGEFVPKENAWKKGNGFVDPFRPTIQPEPFSTVAEMNASRDEHLAAVRAMFSQTDVFVFTLSHTEVWVSKEDGAVFPVPAGISGGEHDPGKYKLLAFSTADVIKDLQVFIEKLRKLRPEARLLLSVSPIPMAVTAMHMPVLAADKFSKSVLHAAAALMPLGRPFVDYFPAYEMIASPVMRGRFYSPDFTGVTTQGVQYVMQQFFDEHLPDMSAEGDADVDGE